MVHRIEAKRADGQMGCLYGSGIRYRGSQPIPVVLAKGKSAQLPLYRTMLTAAQLVQARMWAQGLTVGVLVTSAIVAGTTSKDGKPVERVDHSWEDILGEYSDQLVTDRCHCIFRVSMLMTFDRGRGTDEPRRQT